MRSTKCSESAVEAARKYLCCVKSCGTTTGTLCFFLTTCPLGNRNRARGSAGGTYAHALVYLSQTANVMPQGVQIPLLRGWRKMNRAAEATNGCAQRVAHRRCMIVRMKPAMMSAPRKAMVLISVLVSLNGAMICRPVAPKPHPARQNSTAPLRLQRLCRAEDLRCSTHMWKKVGPGGRRSRLRS
jgi:hypothetical protein